jgi:putative zinc finger protein
MTQETTWHAGRELLARYADGTLGRAGQAAIETHLTSCPTCRADAARMVADEALEPVWSGITSAISAPRLAWPLRLLGQLGVRHTDLVVLRASSAIYLSWALAVAGALVFVAVSGSLSTHQQQIGYALVAPLLPALLVAAAYDASDPSRELLAATPFSKLRVALLRTALAMVAALPVVVLMGVIVPALESQRGGWLLPSLALTTVALVLLTWFTAPVTMGVLGTAWVVVVTAWAARASLEAVTTVGVQSAFLALCLLAAAALAWRLTDHRLSAVRPGGRP